jgi:hypothetical protein
MTNTILFPLAPALQSGAKRENGFITICNIISRDYGDSQTAVITSFESQIKLIKKWLYNKGINYKIE